MVRVGIALIFAGLLTSCAAPQMVAKTTYMPDGSTVVEEDATVAVEKQRQIGIQKCEEARKAEAEAKKLEASKPVACPPGLSEANCTAFIFSEVSARNTANTIEAMAGLLGKGQESCASMAGRGLFDFKIVEVTEMNKTARHYGDTAGGWVRDLMLGIFGITAVKEAGDEQTQHIQGDNNSPSAAGRRTSESTATGAANDGDVIAQPGADSGDTPVIPGITPVPTEATAE